MGLPRRGGLSWCFLHLKAAYSSYRIFPHSIFAALDANDLARKNLFSFIKVQRDPQLGSEPYKRVLFAIYQQVTRAL
ncbi:hypothetical protein HZZ02_19695 [Streptococcus danieliae]|nr:hypothetical protein [Streptococcus danieliae]